MQGPVEFFHGMEAAFARTIAGGGDVDTIVQRLAEQAFDLFEQNVAIQTEGLPPLACSKGCPTCCALRVTATAPEIFLLARYVRWIEASANGRAIGLAARVAEADEATERLGEGARLQLGRPCPFMLRDACIIHPVRPLACRGHAAFAVQDCLDAASGEAVEVTVSEPHLVLRGLVQNALQSALRDAGLPWGLYELNHALALALAAPERQEDWAAGVDSLAPAIPDLDMKALAAMFDQLRAM